jgi:hypothetical protein
LAWVPDLHEVGVPDGARELDGARVLNGARERGAVRVPVDALAPEPWWALDVVRERALGRVRGDARELALVAELVP